MLKLKRNAKNQLSQGGYALVSALTTGVVALAVTSVIIIRLSNVNSQIIRSEAVDQQMGVAETVLNHVLDQMADITGASTNPVDNNGSGIYVTATDLAAYLQSSDFLNSTDNSGASFELTPLTSADMPSGQTPQLWTTTGDTGQFWNSLYSNGEHSQNFWTKFKKDSSGNALDTLDGNLNLGSTYTDVDISFKTSSTAEMIHSKAYTMYRYTRNNKSVDVSISVVPVATDIDGVSDEALHNDGTFVGHHDVFKIRVATYSPSYKANQNPIKTVDVLVNRPAKRSTEYETSFQQAILAGGTVDLQNFDTSSGPCAAGDGGAGCIDTATSGDIHSNSNIMIGPNGSVQGKITASGTANVNGVDIPTTDFVAGTGDVREDSATVTGKVANPTQSQSGVEEIPIPVPNMDTSAIDSVACVDQDPSASVVRYENCMLDDSVSLSGPKEIQFVGEVHITGDLSLSGPAARTCLSPTGERCKIIIDGTMSQTGNGNATSSAKESLYIIKGTGVSAGTACLDIGGTPDASGVHGSMFYVHNPNCDSQVRGNAEFFGAIITQGTVSPVGNASTYGIQRDADMSALVADFPPKPLEKAELFPQVIAWKDVKGN